MLLFQDPSLAEFFPLTSDWRWQVVVLVGGLILLLVGSEVLMYWFVAHCVVPNDNDPAAESPTDRRGAGRIIGKCENLLVFVLVLLNRFDGIGLVLAAKSIARMDAMRKNPSYYLGGTLVNFVWSLVVSLAIRCLVFGPP